MQCILSDIGQLQGLQGEFLYFRQNLRLNDLAAEKMVWMPEDSDIGMKRLKSRFGVRGTYCRCQLELNSAGWDSRVRMAETSL
jgi:hypothetical protein